jgi:dTDP-4-dehydrorhamnose 3,5-epimerase
MLNIKKAEIPDIKIITVEKFGDRRGFFSEVYTRRAFADAGIDLDFVQDNHAYSADRGTLRGLHFQSPPSAQAKLLWVTRGRILDVAVDLRRSSPTFGRHVAIELSAENWLQVLVPIGFAHALTATVSSFFQFEAAPVNLLLRSNTIRRDDRALEAEGHEKLR